MLSLLPVAKPSPLTPPVPSTTSTDQHTEMLVRLWHGCIALLMAVFAQVLIAGIQRLLAEADVDFPPSILAMAGVFLAFLVCGCIHPAVDRFYQKHLKSPANLLNRHMSVGFTVPFVMICRSPLASPQTIGLIIACFVLTGVINTISSYGLALPLQMLMSRWDNRVGGSGSVESVDGKDKAYENTSSDDSSTYRGSEESYCCASGRSSTPSSSVVESAPEPETTASAALYSWALQNPMMLLSWSLTLLLGLPIRYTTGNPTVLTTALLAAVWLTTLSLQATVKTTTGLAPWLRTLLSSAANPVLWTSLVLIAYTFAESAATHQPVSVVLDTLESHTTLSDLILQQRPSAMAAGDIALSLLNAGLVSWGLKLYEYRAQLLSRAGLTVFAVSSMLAFGNVALGPLLARALGLGPGARNLAFAARSVTLALGSPVMSALGGDVGLNAAMVVISGVLFQMGLGFGVGGWLERVLRQVLPRHGVAAAVTDIEAQGGECRSESNAADAPETVAAGVTIGINAAAMGTAYLYEVGSDAAPYSALSMMALGIMTVVFSSIQPLAGWVVSQAATAAF
ncbi:hypothetical protein QBC47DRAFT_401284 [Echria macrotheca]|uniref:LrgB-like protein n=1 Tax=Echria macrotheca TaxID=438768 RepID=A0AAJ0BDP5_9PEZI|nr:hypothetical protein QBC47DRAFT_401284 [Echria macrotheca]